MGVRQSRTRRFAIQNEFFDNDVPFKVPINAGNHVIRLVCHHAEGNLEKFHVKLDYQPYSCAPVFSFTVYSNDDCVVTETGLRMENLGFVIGKPFTLDVGVRRTEVKVDLNGRNLFIENMVHEVKYMIVLGDVVVHSLTSAHEK